VVSANKHAEHPSTPGDNGGTLRRVAGL